MQKSSHEVSNLSAVSIGGGWISEGSGFSRATMSHDKGIAITKRVNPDGSTDFIFSHAVSPTPQGIPGQK